MPLFCAGVKSLTVDGCAHGPLFSDMAHLSAAFLLLSAACGLVAFGATLLGVPARTFLPYDDLANFVNEDGWRTGSFSEQLAWALTATTGLVFEPLAWWLKSVQHRWWSGSSLDPTGFAQVSAAAHLAAATLLAAALEELLISWLGNDDADSDGRDCDTDKAGANTCKPTGNRPILVAPPPPTIPTQGAPLSVRPMVRACCALTACWWCVHPLRAEVVGWCSAQSYSFAALFGAASLLLHARARRIYTSGIGGDSRPLLSWAGGLVCYVAACCCKSVAVPLPALLAAVELSRPVPLVTRCSDSSDAGSRSGGGILFAIRALLAHILTALWPVVSSVPGGGGGVCWHVAAGAGVASFAAAANDGGEGVGAALRSSRQRIAVSASTLRRYGAQLASVTATSPMQQPQPQHQLGAFYDVDVRARVRWPWSGGGGNQDDSGYAEGATLLCLGAGTALLLCAGICALSFRSAHGARQGRNAVQVPAVTALAALWCCGLLVVLPTLSIFTHGSDSAGADRYLHLASWSALPPVAATLLWGVRKLAPTPAQRQYEGACGQRKWQLALLTLAAALLLPLALATAERLRGWAAPRPFYTREHGRSPGSARVLNDLLKAHLDSMDGRAALRALDGALAGCGKGKKSAKCTKLLGDANLMATVTSLLTRTADDPSMRTAPAPAAAAAVTTPSNAPPLLLPRYAEAVALSQEAIRWTPSRKAVPMLVNVGRAHLKLRHFDEARKVLTRARSGASSPALAQVAAAMLLEVDEQQKQQQQEEEQQQ